MNFSSNMSSPRILVTVDDVVLFYQDKFNPFTCISKTLYLGDIFTTWIVEPHALVWSKKSGYIHRTIKVYHCSESISPTIGSYMIYHPNAKLTAQVKDIDFSQWAGNKLGEFFPITVIDLRNSTAEVDSEVQLTFTIRVTRINKTVERIGLSAIEIKQI